MKEWRIETISFVKVVVQSPTSRNLLLDPEKVETWRIVRLWRETVSTQTQRMLPYNAPTILVAWGCQKISCRDENQYVWQGCKHSRGRSGLPHVSEQGNTEGSLKQQNKTTQLSHSLLRALRFTNQGPQWCVRHDLFNGWDIPCYSLAAALVRVHLPTDLVLILLSNLFSLVESILGIHVWSSYSHSFGNSRLAPLIPGRVSCSCS